MAGSVYYIRYLLRTRVNLNKQGNRGAGERQMNIWPKRTNGIMADELVLMVLARFIHIKTPLLTLNPKLNPIPAG